MEGSAQGDLLATDKMTLAQLIISGLGLAFSLMAAAMLFLIGFVGLFSETVLMANILPMFTLAWVSLLAAALALPSLLFSIGQIRGRTPQLPRIQGFRLASIFLLLWPLVLVLGNLLASQTRIAWLVMPPLQILAIGLPIWWLFEVASRRLSVGSHKRGWGVVNFGLFLTTPTVILVEMVILGFLFMLIILWIMTQPDLMNELERLAQQILATQPDPDKIIEYIRPYLQNPLVIFGIFAVIAGLVPLIEELLKPLALWALAGQRLTPAQGFVGGALSGGSFALLESLLSLSDPGQGQWVALAAGRAGTALLHITTTALVGWALALAWQKGSYLRLGATYLLAVGLHGVWNMLSIFSGLGIILEEIPQNMQILNVFSQAAPFALVALVLLLFTLLWLVNLRLQRTEPIKDRITSTDPSLNP